MIGIQEYISYKNKRTNRRDLFCGKCLSLLRMNTTLTKKTEIKCECGMINVFLKKDPVRFLSPDFKTYNRRFPIAYWSRKYGIPANDCYMSFRKHGIGSKEKHKVGSPVLMTQREFLSAAVFTGKGRKIISDLIKHRYLLTHKEITDSIN